MRPCRRDRGHIAREYRFKRTPSPPFPYLVFLCSRSATAGYRTKSLWARLLQTALIPCFFHTRKEYSATSHQEHLLNVVKALLYEVLPNRNEEHGAQLPEAVSLLSPNSRALGNRLNRGTKGPVGSSQESGGSGQIIPRRPLEAQSRTGIVHTLYSV